MRKTLLSITILGLLAAGTAFADPKRINGAMCELEQDLQISFVDRGALRIGAHDGEEVGVVCPLLRANTTNTTGLLNLIVHVFKQNATTFTCFGESYDQSGNALKIVSKSTSTTGQVPLTWNNTINVSSSKGTYGVVCYAIGGTGGDWGDEIFAVDYDEP